MKYFTKEWVKTNCFENDKAFKEYRDNLEKIKNQLPSSLYYFAKNINLHDGLIKNINYDNNSKLSIIITCGDNQRGYSEISIVYNISSKNSKRTNNLIRDIQNNNYEILYYEIDIFNDDFIHRFLLYPLKEVEIIFHGFDFQQTSVKSRY